MTILIYIRFETMNRFMNGVRINLNARRGGTQ
jgi:hypothetical protein